MNNAAPTLDNSAKEEICNPQSNGSEAETSTVTIAAVDRPWHVVVCNDPVNLMTYVVMVFKKVFGYSNAKARKHMMEVHQLGESIVWTGEREKAENYVYLLQQWQLTAILRQDDA